MSLGRFIERVWLFFFAPKPQPPRNSSGPSNTFVAASTNLFSSAPANTISSAQITSTSNSPRTAERTQLPNLDASQFAPITSAEALAGVKASKTIFNNPWWGRLDTIPPATDDRTLLIDRTLVAYGFFRPEELVEIHKIGDRMLELKGDLHLARAAAADAVKEDRAERAKRKEQKQAEAVERKRKHAEKVAHRRATDIVYLGRGVSRGLADHRSNIERLQAARLPILSTPADLASALEITIPKLRWLAFHSDAVEKTHYVRFSVPKKSGGQRELAAPHRELAKTQRWIFQNILQAVRCHDAAHGFIKGRSIRSNALSHVGQQVVLNCDLKDFFPTITFHRILGGFQQLGYSPAVATILALLCTEAPRRMVEYAGKTFHVAAGPRALPQGACTSPALSNLIARRLDSRLHGLTTKMVWRYTRYADDLTLSAPKNDTAEKQIGYLLARVRHILRDEGFAINETKTRVQKPNTAMMVTGIVVNEQLAVPRKVRRRLRAILHNCAKQGIASQNRDHDPQFLLRTQGKISFIQMINRDHAEPLQAAFDAIAR